MIRKNIPYQVFLWILLGLLVLTIFIPLLNVVSLAFSSNMASMRPGIVLWPREFSTEGFVTLFKQLDFWRPFLNTLYITVFGVILHTFFCCLGGYVLAQPNLPFKHLLVGMIIVTVTIPSQVVMIPLYMVFKDLHLLNKLTSVVIAEMITGYGIILMRNYFESVPKELVETSKLDGAGVFQIFWYVYVPVTIPGVVTLVLFDIIHKYNTFIKPLILIPDDQTKQTLQVALKAIVRNDDATSSSTIITDNVVMAAIVVALVPLILFYPTVQRYFIKGSLSGSVKG